MAKTPNPIDLHVGSRVRMRRMLLSMSQEKLGEALGVTFQQVQKYEKGMNRIGASRLQDIAKVLDLTPSFFFEGAPPAPGQHAQPGVTESPAWLGDFLATRGGLSLAKSFQSIKSEKMRWQIVNLVAAIAGDDQAQADAA